MIVSHLVALINLGADVATARSAPCKDCWQLRALVLWCSQPDALCVCANGTPGNTIPNHPKTLLTLWAWAWSVILVYFTIVAHESTFLSSRSPVLSLLPMFHHTHIFTMTRIEPYWTTVHITGGLESTIINHSYHIHHILTITSVFSRGSNQFLGYTIDVQSSLSIINHPRIKNYYIAIANH